MADSEIYLRAILATVGRQTFPPDKLRELVSPFANSLNQLQAFNMCDGGHSQADICKAFSFDKGNLSKTINKWIDDGIVIRSGEGREMRPVHIYPLPERHFREAIASKDKKK